MGRASCAGLGRWLLFLGLIAGLAVTGCGGASNATVSGKVTYKGAPVKGGYVTFVSANGVTRPGPIAEDGTYTINQLPTGPAKIAVETDSVKPLGGTGKGKTASGGPPPKKYGPPPGSEQGSVPYKPPDLSERANRYVQIPEKYADFDKSGLTYTVTGGSQKHDIVLE
jgi:hypothetical protein